MRAMRQKDLTLIAPSREIAGAGRDHFSMIFLYFKKCYQLLVLNLFTLLAMIFIITRTRRHSHSCAYLRKR